MTDTMNIEAVRELYAAAQAVDLEKAMSLLHPDIVVREPSVLPYGGVYHGIDGFAEVLKSVVHTIDLGSLKVNSIASDGTTAMVKLEGLLVSGDPVELIEAWTMRDGLFVTCQVFWFDPAPVLAPSV